MNVRSSTVEELTERSQTLALIGSSVFFCADAFALTEGTTAANEFLSDTQSLASAGKIYLLQRFLARVETLSPAAMVAMSVG